MSEEWITANSRHPDSCSEYDVILADDVAHILQCKDTRIKELEQKLADTETEKYRLLSVAADLTERVEELERKLAAIKKVADETCDYVPIDIDGIIGDAL